jgi:hypothetical protein
LIERDVYSENGGMKKITSVVLPGAMALAGAVAVTIADGAAFGQASAQSLTWERPSRGAPKGDYVVAHSRWGHGSTSGPVRRAKNGWEVRLPRGTWIPCRRSCSEELRLATVDFWETQGRDAPDGGPGYFRFNFWF